MVRTRALPLALTAASALTTGCSSSFGGDFGISPGGSQDIELARSIIEDGRVPRADQFTAEGLFSQHDIATPSSTEPCAELLCPRASIARIEPVDGSGEQVLVQLALATNVAQFERADVNLAAVVDISGSMSGERIDLVKLGLHAAVDQLDADDRMSLVSFGGEARVEAPSTVMDASGRAALHAKITALEIEGSTNIEEGLVSGYASLDGTRDGLGGREDRVMLFTDAQPNVGATDPDSFVGIVEAGADEGVGVSVFGVGADFGAELARRVSEVRGGNSYYFGDEATVSQVFGAEFEYLVTPVAYDLHFTVRPSEGFGFLAAYGTPDANASDEVDVSIATAFLSARGGAMAVVLDGDLDALSPGAPVVSFALEYQTADGQAQAGSIDATWLGGGDLPIGTAGIADDAGSAKLAVLLDEFLALEAGAAFCEGSLTQTEALARIDEAATRLAAMSQLLGDAALNDEASLMHKLAANLDDGC